jgi:hypothetical protein
MTSDVTSRFRAFAFGDVEGKLWGGALDVGTPALVFGAAGGTGCASGPAAVDWSPEGRGWRLSGDGFELHVKPLGEELPAGSQPDPSAGLTGFEELCRVEGVVGIGADEHAVDCVGTRCVVDGIDVRSLDSVRAVSGWFADDQALALLAFRARRSIGHEADLIAATLFDPDGWMPVQDPRLSTTYADSGLPARANLELWIGEGENEFPRRASAEVAGAGARVKADGLELLVAPLHCHSRGLDGAGVYVLATF